MRRRWRHAHGGGGCGRFRGGPIDLGAPDEERRGGRFGRHFGRRWQRWQRWQDNARGEARAAAPVDVVGSLELNQRQRELFDEALAALAITDRDRRAARLFVVAAKLVATGDAVAAAEARALLAK
ncbi:MAG TPA: hypothetical protein VHB97_05330, partial [Polyangia bacterium]|nr:hypothetical protein [Polyangia bacterium]